MGLLDELLRQAGGPAGGVDQPGGAPSEARGAEILSILNQALASHGGIQGLVGLFQSGGLGSVINSWIGTGTNLPVTPGQLQSVLGSQRLAQIAEKLGVPAGAAASTLAQALPTLIDRATPNGTLSGGADDLLGKAFDVFKK